MVLSSSIYSISEKSESMLLKNKEAVSYKMLEFPDIVEDIGLKGLLANGNDKEEPKKLK
jgi:hypothetical protein